MLPGFQTLLNCNYKLDNPLKNVTWLLNEEKLKYSNYFNNNSNIRH